MSCQIHNNQWRLPGASPNRINHHRSHPLLIAATKGDSFSQGREIIHHFDRTATIAHLKHYLTQSHEACGPLQRMIFVLEEGLTKLEDDNQVISSLGTDTSITVSVKKSDAAAAPVPPPPHAASSGFLPLASSAAPQTCGVLATAAHTVDSHQLEFPVDGVPASYLRQLIDESGGEAALHGMTTSDVKRFIIIPKTEASKLSLCAQLRLEGDARVQPATWFVSHPWQIRFLDLVEALEDFFSRKPGAVLWLDLLCTSQHSTALKPPEWWQETFYNAIGRIGQLVMVMTPWHNPVCLKRAWCLFELYACRRHGGCFDVALPSTDRACFLATIVESSDAFFDMLGTVNTSRSECSREIDKQRIFAAVRELEGGFTALDRSVLNTITEWLQVQLEQRREQALHDGLEHSACQFNLALADLFEKKSDFNRAHELFEQCFTVFQALSGPLHVDTLMAQCSLAYTLTHKGDFERALQLATDCMAKRAQVLGHMHPLTLHSLFRIASIHFSAKQYDKSLVLHEECLSKRATVLGSSHPKTLISMYGLAQVLSMTGQRSRELELLQQCSAESARVNGEDHPHSLLFRSALASCYRSHSQHDKALEIFEQCHASECRVLGEEHENSIITLFNMANLLGEAGQPERALPLFKKCLSSFTVALGREHATTQKCRDCIQRCQLHVRLFSGVSSADRKHFLDMIS
jgi:tetratricopeptide (TPR) repeat protein